MRLGPVGLSCCERWSARPRSASMPDPGPLIYPPPRNAARQLAFMALAACSGGPNERFTLLLAVLLSLAAALGCGTHYIPNTDVEDNDYNRKIMQFCEEYRRPSSAAIPRCC